MKRILALLMFFTLAIYGQQGDSYNSSTTNLDSAATYTGTGRIITYGGGISSITVSILLDHAGAVAYNNNTLYVEFSNDNSNWDKSISHTISDSTNYEFFFPMLDNYYRVRVTNDTVDTDEFRLTSVIHETGGTVHSVLTDTTGIPYDLRSRLDIIADWDDGSDRAQVDIAQQTLGEVLIAGGATQTNDVKVTLDGESVPITIGSEDSLIVYQPNYNQLKGTFKIGDGTETANVNASNQLEVDVKSLNDGGNSVTIDQSTHDNLNANANIQIGDADVGVGNPVPISDGGSDLNVEVTETSFDATQSTHDNLNANANLQVGDADNSTANPVYTKEIIDTDFTRIDTVLDIGNSITALSSLIGAQTFTGGGFYIVNEENGETVVIGDSDNNIGTGATNSGQILTYKQSFSDWLNVYNTSAEVYVKGSAVNTRIRLTAKVQ